MTRVELPLRDDVLEYHARGRVLEVRKLRGPRYFMKLKGGRLGGRLLAGWELEEALTRGAQRQEQGQVTSLSVTPRAVSRGLVQFHFINTGVLP